MPHGWHLTTNVVGVEHQFISYYKERLTKHEFKYVGKIKLKKNRKRYNLLMLALLSWNQRRENNKCPQSYGEEKMLEKAREKI